MQAQKAETKTRDNHTMQENYCKKQSFELFDANKTCLHKPSQPFRR
jgi:hypothetical protein